MRVPSDGHRLNVNHRLNVDPEVWRKLHLIAGHRQVSMAQLLGDLLAEVTPRAYGEVVTEVNKRG
jgi:hypothetical protein